jgi:MFS family permease
VHEHAGQRARANPELVGLLCQCCVIGIIETNGDSSGHRRSLVHRMRSDAFLTADFVGWSPKWGGKGSLWTPHVYMPAQNPGDPSGMSAFGPWMYGPWFWPPVKDVKYPPMANPYYDATCDPNVQPFCEPALIPSTPNVSVGMEAFNRLFLAAIILFLVGSALCGFSQNLPQLIGFRALQGLGGAGLLVSSQAIVADVVPPRDRGKFLGPIGSVFGLATVISPLIGGALTDAASWRWIFWLNLPIGLVALCLAVISLRLARRQRTTPVDVWGIVVLTVTTSCIVLVCAWGGSEFAWTSPTMLLLMAFSVAGVAVFGLIERRAVDPLIPLSLLRDRTVLIAIGLSLVIGPGLFGVISYVPSYAQMVYTTGATSAGMLLLPLTLGIMATNISAGLLISRYGRYKVFPIVGTVVAGAAMLLLTTMTASTPIWLLAVYLTVLGMGVGFFMQIAMVAVQNAVPAAVVGTATSTVTFFREIGVTIGAAVVGGAFGSRLAAGLPANLPAGLDAAHLTPQAAETLSVDLRATVSLAYVDALVPLFRWIAALFAVGLVLALLLPKHELSRQLTSVAKSPNQRCPPSDRWRRGEPAPARPGAGAATGGQPGSRVKACR